MVKTKAIIFDCDDTLVQTSKVVYQAMKDLGKDRYHLTITDDVIHSLYGEPMDIFFEKLYRYAEPWEQIKKHYKQYRERYPNIAYEDALQFIQKLDPEIITGVLSSSDTDIVERDLVSTGYDLDRFVDVQGSDKTGVHKPDPEVFTPFLKKLKLHRIDPNEVVYIGDSLHDYFASVGAGLKFIGLYDRTTSKPDFDRGGATCVSTFNVIKDLFD